MKGKILNKIKVLPNHIPVDENCIEPYICLKGIIMERTFEELDYQPTLLAIKHLKSIMESIESGAGLDSIIIVNNYILILAEKYRLALEQNIKLVQENNTLKTAQKSF